MESSIISIDQIYNDTDVKPKLKNYFEPIAGFNSESEIKQKETLDNTFFNVMKREVDRVNERQLSSIEKMYRVEMGEDDDLVGAVMSIQKASMTFQLLMQVRNKMVDGYNELMSQQV